MLKNDKLNRKLSDKKLLQLVQENSNHLAFTQIYKRYSRILYILSLKYLQDTNMAQEAVQIIFVAFWEKRKKIAITGCLRNYLYTMTRNYLIDQIQNNKQVILNYIEAQQLHLPTESALDKMEKEDLLKALKTAFNLLSKRKKEICKMKLEDKMTNKQIADILQISVSAVKENYSHAKVILKNQLKKLLIFITFISYF
ncbi:MAG: RNA polymerase sigma factor [Tenacibaculum sp.]